MKKCLIIIPAFNEEKNIGKLINELALYNMKDNFNINMEIIVINDCSNDNTSKVCRMAGINVIDLPCNLGIGGAVQTGYIYARANDFDIAVQIDGDGQHDPAYLEKLIKPLLNNDADLLIGSRFIENKGFQSSKARRLGIRFFSYLLALLGGAQITDPTSGFRACNKELIKIFSYQYPKDYPEPESIMSCLRNGYRIKEIPVIMRCREMGSSSINFNRSFYYMMKVSLAIFIDFLRKKNIGPEV